MNGLMVVVGWLGVRFVHGDAREVDFTNADIVWLNDAVSYAIPQGICTDRDCAPSWVYSHTAHSSRLWSI